MVKVKYSPTMDQDQEWDDHLYGSGHWVVGEAREVDDWTAVCLLKHTEFTDARPLKLQKDLDATAPVVKEPEEETTELAPLVQIDSMTKEQVAVFAKRQFGIDLPGSLKKGEMVEKVRFLMGRK